MEASNRYFPVERISSIGVREEKNFLSNLKSLILSKSYPFNLSSKFDKRQATAEQDPTLIPILLIVLLLLSGCAKDFDLNPWTTVLKQTLKGNYDKTK